MNEEKIRLYDSHEHYKFHKKRILQKAMRTLSGLLRGVCADGVVNKAEQAVIKAWIDENQEYTQTPPWSVVVTHLQDYLEDGQIDQEEIEDMLWLSEKLSEWTEFDDLIKDRLQELHGFFHGLIADQKLNEEELIKLKDWVFNNEYLAGSYPYDEIASLLVEIFKDGVITPEERNQIMVFISQFVGTNNTSHLAKEKLAALKKKYTISGICAVDPCLEFEGKTFCITGEFKHNSRSEVIKKIEAAGGIVKPGVSKKIDYLIVGAAGNPCWAYACYGRKVEHAVELRKQGAKLVIVSERDFLDAL